MYDKLKFVVIKISKGGMPKLIEFQTSPEQLHASSDVVKLVEHAIHNPEKNVIFKTDQLKNHPFSIRINVGQIDSNSVLPTLVVEAEIIDDDKKERIPFCGLTVNIEPTKSNDAFISSATYSNMTRLLNLEVQFSGVTGLLSSIDDAISQAVSNTYKVNVNSEILTRERVIKSVLPERMFTFKERGIDLREKWNRVFVPNTGEPKL